MDSFFQSFLNGAGGRPYKRPNYVRLAPEDNGEGLMDAFFEHPDAFKPYKDPKTGWVEDWGVFDPDDETLGMGQMMRTMRTQMMYYGAGQISPTPELQFIEALIEKKLKRLQSVDVTDLRKQDYVFKIELRTIPNAEGAPRIWRRFRCSGGTPLFTFADKILLPLMGWVRNYHCYIFTDLQDGAQFGPENCDAIDIMHVAMHGYKYIPDTKWHIANLLQKERQQAGWVYDLGDNWVHTLTVEAILPPDRSTGKVEVLAGAGACPPEDGNGNHNWVDALKKWDSGVQSDRREVLGTVKGSLNYRGKVRNDWTPDRFDLPATRACVAQALSSTASVFSGTKKFVAPLVPGAESFGEGWGRRAGEKDVLTREKDSPFMFMRETVSERKDGRGIAVCAACGSPNGLKRCSACQKTSYCGQECQRAHWKAHKEECKNATAAK